MRCKKKLIRFILGCLSLFFFYAFLSFSYLCPDARYARDNLEYLSIRAGGVLDVRGIHALAYPLPKAVNDTVKFADRWTYCYLMDNESFPSPHDAMSRLIISSNIQEAEDAYQVIPCLAAVTEPDINLDKDMMNALKQEKINRNKTAEAAVRILAVKSVLLFIPGWCCFLGWIFLGISVKKHPCRKRTAGEKSIIL